MKKLVIVLTLLLSTSFIMVGCGNKEVTEYRNGLQDVVDEMISNTEDIEVIVDKYSSLWSYTIKSRGSISTEDMSSATGLNGAAIAEYFPINTAGNITDDFSTVIHSMKSYYEDMGKLSKIEELSNEIKDKVSELKDPPDKFKETYEEVLDLYDYHEEYKDLALNPSGSLTEFNEKASNLIEGITSKYNRIEVIIPDEK